MPFYTSANGGIAINDHRQFPDELPTFFTVYALGRGHALAVASFDSGRPPEGGRRTEPTPRGLPQYVPRGTRNLKIVDEEDL